MPVTEHVHAIKVPFQIAIPGGMTVERFVYVCLVCGKGIGLIDTGVAGSEKTILDFVHNANALRFATNASR